MGFAKDHEGKGYWKKDEVVVVESKPEEPKVEEVVEKPKLFRKSSKKGKN